MRFFENSHLYVTDDGELYPSVTSVIKHYQPFKDWDAIATAYAKKHKLKVENVKNDWKIASDESIKRGIAYHKKMEEKLSVPTIIVNDITLNVYPSPTIDGVKEAKEQKLEEGVYPEFLVYSNRYRVAGQSDYIQVLDGVVTIKDYKTNKKIDLESYKDWKGTRQHQMMAPPVSHIMDSNYWHYALQLNLYMYIVLSHNPTLKPGDMILEHVTAAKDFFGEPKLTEYRVPNLQKEIRDLLENLKTNPVDVRTS